MNVRYIKYIKYVIYGDEVFEIVVYRCKGSMYSIHKKNVPLVECTNVCINNGNLNNLRGSACAGKQCKYKINRTVQ